MVISNPVSVGYTYMVLVLQHGQRVHAFQLKYVVYLSQLSDGDSVHRGEPLPYQFETELSPEGDNIPVDKEKRLWPIVKLICNQLINR